MLYVVLQSKVWMWGEKSCKFLFLKVTREVFLKLMLLYIIRWHNSHVCWYFNWAWPLSTWGRSRTCDSGMTSMHCTYFSLQWPHWRMFLPLRICGLLEWTVSRSATEKYLSGAVGIDEQLGLSGNWDWDHRTENSSVNSGENYGKMSKSIHMNKYTFHGLRQECWASVTPKELLIFTGVCKQALKIKVLVFNQYMLF